MKVSLECVKCLLIRGVAGIKRATDNNEVRFRAVSKLLELLAREFSPEAVPARLGTLRERLIKEITGNPDPYFSDKKRSNALGKRLAGQVEEVVRQEDSVEKRFALACRAAVLGNLIEFDIPGHDFSLEKLEHMLRNTKLSIDNSERILRAIRPGAKVLYVTDNAGEIAFDKILVGVLEELGAKVAVAVRGGPVLNDATLEDALEVGMNEVATEVITTGCDAVGVDFELVSKEFLDKYLGSDLIVAKGMGNYETLSEERMGKPVAYLLVAKCEPVARHIGVERGSAVVKLVK